MGSRTQAEGGESGLPVGNIDGRNTGSTPGNGASRVRAFYTVSSPGSKPDWIACGTETAPGDSLLRSAANNGVRCTLQYASHQTQITAVALVANNSQDEFDTRLNGAGDATRVLDAYAQLPGALTITEGETGQVDGKTDIYPAGDSRVDGVRNRLYALLGAPGWEQPTPEPPPSPDPLAAVRWRL